MPLELQVFQKEEVSFVRLGFAAGESIVVPFCTKPDTQQEAESQIHYRSMNFMVNEFGGELDPCWLCTRGIMILALGAIGTIGAGVAGAFALATVLGATVALGALGLWIFAFRTREPRRQRRFLHPIYRELHKFAYADDFEGGLDYAMKMSEAA